MKYRVTILWGELKMTSGPMDEVYAVALKTMHEQLGATVTMELI